MARKRSSRARGDAVTPKQLRKRLRRAERELAVAQRKRDRAQARLEARAIIADELRAQLAEADAAAQQEAATADEVTAQPPKPPRARPPKAAKAPATDEPPAAGSDGTQPSVAAADAGAAATMPVSGAPTAPPRRPNARSRARTPKAS